jgi:hypothetical protein
MTWPLHRIYKVFKPLFRGIGSPSIRKHVTSEKDSHEKMSDNSYAKTINQRRGTQYGSLLTKEYVVHEVENSLLQGEPAGY